MGGPLSITDMYTFETCRRLNPVAEERMREAIRETERLAFLHAVDADRFRIIDAWITALPPAEATGYVASASALRNNFSPARVRAKKRRIWWLPWRKGGGRG